MLKIKTIAIFRKFSTVIIIWIQFVNASVLIATDIRLAFSVDVTVVAEFFQTLAYLNGATVSFATASMIIVPLCWRAVWILDACLMALLGIRTLIFDAARWATFVTRMTIIIKRLLTLEANLRIYTIIMGATGWVHAFLVLYIKTIVITFARLLLRNINTTQISTRLLQLFK